jgi:hypothetical protein
MSAATTRGTGRRAARRLALPRRAANVSVELAFRDGACETSD